MITYKQTNILYYYYIKMVLQTVSILKVAKRTSHNKSLRVEKYSISIYHQIIIETVGLLSKSSRTVIMTGLIVISSYYLKHMNSIHLCPN